jgi:hypothetical protein
MEKLEDPRRRIGNDRARAVVGHCGESAAWTSKTPVIETASGVAATVERGKQVLAMSWWKTSWARLAKFTAAARLMRRWSRQSRATCAPDLPSVNHPLPSQGKQKVVPSALRVAMTTVQTGDFTFDPVHGR